jgi:two-component system nitrogen regulation response regulator GlnG
VAGTLHRHSIRAGKPFVALNMAAIPRELIESELFGHERGAFTGANNQRVGRFEQADGGTLFLDEIGDMPLEIQTRLLRVLQEGEFYRVGGTTPIKVDVRIIAATHQDLEQLVDTNRFRKDLFYRLNVIRIHLPDLTERREDIPQLTQHFLTSAAKEMGVEQKRLDSQTLSLFTQLPWPGNVRQLENVCRWLTVMVSGSEVHLEDLPEELHGERGKKNAATGDWQRALNRWARLELSKGRGDLLGGAQPDFERILLQAALEQTGGRKQEAAKLLGWGRNTLTRKLKELGITQDDEAE